MAIYHLSAQVISRKSGRSTTAAAAYRAGEEITDQRTGEVHDYTRKGGVAGSEILAPDDAPAWVFDRSELWNKVEAKERRKDSQLCREVNVALPVELTDDQKIETVRSFVQAEMVRQGMVVDIAYHDFDSNNPHAHLMETMRDLEPDGFGKKNRDWNDRGMLHGWREKWADHVNQALERAGVETRIDHRSYEDQGIDQEPTIHIGPAAAAMERKNPGSTRVVQINDEIKKRNLERELNAQDIDEATRDLGMLEAFDEYLEGEAVYLQTVIDNERRQEAIAMADDDHDQAAEHERPAPAPSLGNWLGSPAPEPQPSPAAAKPPRQPEKPKKPPTDEKLSESLGKVLDEQPVPEPDGTIWEGRSLEGWLRERWETVTERAKNMAESVRERLRPLFEREATQRAEDAGYRRESIESAGLEPSGPDPADEARKRAELKRERSLVAERMSNEQQRIVSPNDLVIDQDTGEWREGTKREVLEQWEPENPEKLSLLDRRMLEEQRRLEIEPPEPEYDEPSGPSLG